MIPMQKSLFVIYSLLCLILISCNADQNTEIATDISSLGTPTDSNSPALTVTVSPTNTAAPTSTQVHQEREIYNIASSPNGSLQAVSASYGVQVYDLVTGKLIFYFEKESRVSFQGIYSYIAWSPDGDFLAVGKPNIGVRIWDTSTWKLVAEKGDDQFNGYELPGFAWSPDGSHLALGMGKGVIQIWDKNTNSWLVKTNCGVYQTSITWSPDGQIWIFPVVGIYNAETCERVENSNIATDVGYSYAVWSPDKKNVYVFFDLGGGITDISGYDAQFGSCCYSEIAWSTDGRYFAATPERSNEITVWDTQENRIVRQEKQGDMIYAFSWLPNNELLATGRMKGKDVLWNTDTGKILITLEE
jgi:WD40 repeat protein